MRLLAWNIRQGGGSRLARIAEALAQNEADILVLSEYRGGEAASRLLAVLRDLGYRYATARAPPPSRSGVLIAARHAFGEHSAMGSKLSEPYRLISVEIASIRLIGVYMPNLLAKIPYWEALIAVLLEHTGRHSLAVGDFNTCRAYLDEAGAIDKTALYMDKIAEIGFCDLWRQRHPTVREYSWYSTRGNGFRIDHAFLSSSLATCAGAIRYSHQERIAGISDHSPLILDLEL